MAERRLRDLERCLRGSTPATIATCSPEGTPNITYLSIVHYVDDEHVALSNQFFNKTQQNVRVHPRAQLLVLDGATLVQYRMDLRFLRTESAGPVFERMRTNLDAVASQTGMTGVFRLQSADIFKVTRIDELAHDLDLPQPEEGSTHFVAALDTLGARLGACDELDALLDATLHALDELFAHPHSCILFVDGEGKRLYTVASRGFEESGVGAEVAVGEGIIGTAARDRRAVRVSSLGHERVMLGAVRDTARERGHDVHAHEIRLPGLDTMHSVLALPILMRDRALGVLCVQSPQPGRFTIADEQALSTVARQLAASIMLLGLGADDVPMPHVAPKETSAGHLRAKIVYYEADDSIFIDDEYLIKGLSGRILLRLLRTFERDGRVDFTNKELRADESLKLAGYRDNLEARLILLRRRLEERSDALRVPATGRGRFRLDMLRDFELKTAP